MGGSCTIGTEPNVSNFLRSICYNVQINLRDSNGIVFVIFNFPFVFFGLRNDP
jgi:hypothetical protein